ncbi:TBC1 domain family member 1 [Takifugu flavidus]|uniref:TBC1 domain family member 1 n=1 Tax=Takifugu flavidus TaxID=433684 RepID=A0A5C6MX19_9TELE|nr:TBC1 domain family member 1 [Takifugu flavidus]
MEGLYFEVKSRRGEKERISDNRHPNLTSCSAISRRSSSSLLYCKPSSMRRRMEAISQENEEENDVVEVRYKLTLIGSLSVHYLTTMAMLPWVVAEISKAQDSEKKPAERGPSPQIVFLCVSVSWVRCVSILGEELLWDPLTHRLLFECLPHQVTKLIHNSQEPSSFGCLVRDSANCACYVFRCQDSSKVPEIISVLRKAGKSSARNDNVSKLPSGGSGSSETGGSSLSTIPTTVDSDLLFSTNFAKRFEVLFCGRVTVPHKNAPPALIDECIVKFSQLQNSVVSLREGDTLGLRDGLKTLVVPANGLKSIDVHDGSTGSPTTGKHPVLFKRAPSFPCLQALDENGLSPEICQAITTESHLHLTGVQPTSQQQNSTMLFMVTGSQILLVSPETKKTSMEKSFREISFCSQGIHHVDHFGFICRETAEEGNCHFVCYVFQCASESLVDEIMLTLKQAFSRAVEWKKSNPQWQQCDACPLMQFHRLCERIEGLSPFDTKLELQKHSASLDNQEQASVFEVAMRSCPKSDKEENELVMASLRRLYEKKQSNHQHSVTQNSEEICEKAAPTNLEAHHSSSQQKLGQLKSRAKRSLTESLEGIWKGGNRARTQTNLSSGSGSGASFDTVYSSQEQPCFDDPSPASNSPLRPQWSSGDLKHLDPPSALATYTFSKQGDAELQGVRRRANTFSHSPTPQSAEHSLEYTLKTQKVAASDTSKLSRHYSLSSDTPHQSKHAPADSTLPPVPPSPPSAPPFSPSSGARLMKRSAAAALSHPSSTFEMDESPLRSHSHSWRQQIFLRVATPQKSTENIDCVNTPDGRQVGNVQEKKLNRSKDELRELWRTAIKQQILLQRMEKENLKLKASENNLQNKRLKLDYDEITPCLKEVTLVWEKMLATPDRSKVKVDMEIIHAALAQGVPKQHRGEVWKFLSEQHLLRQTVSSQPPPDNTAYKELLKQVSSEQHAILIDLGRTFPTHPYFEESMGPGQLSLYNVLSAYSVLDPEVGYCQGLCFVTGVLLLHLEEEDAFNMLKFLMFVLGLRQQYKPSMTAVQIQMYQLSRLLHDYHKDLQCHLEQQDIAPSLYAPPWFLTNFASQYPLGFVARVFGPEVIFKVGLSLLGSHKLLIMQHDSLESIVDVIKTELPNLGLVQMEKTVNQVCEMDLTKQLQAYEVEYQVLNDELHAPSDQRSAHLEKVYQSLQQQNSELLEELQVSHVRVSSLEQQLESLVQSERLLKEQVSTLELEKNQLVDTVARLQQILAKLNIQTSSDGHTLPSTSERHKLTAEGEEGKDDSGLSSPLSDFPACLITASGNLLNAQSEQSSSQLGKVGDFYPLPT